MYRYRTFARFPLLVKQKIAMKNNDFTNLSGSKHQTKIPSKILQPPIGYKTVDFKGYRFFLPKIFVRKKGKESEYINLEQKEAIVIQISDYVPVDDLTKMSDNRRDI